MDLRIDIVTFNGAEAAAVEAFFDELVVPGSQWGRRGGDAIELDGPRNVLLRHRSLLAQGNVIAAVRLAEAFANADSSPDFVVFYGCAGALDPDVVGHAFLVGSVSYASLGTVEASETDDAAERVTLKNKWLCHVKDGDVVPLSAMSFEPTIGADALDLPMATTLERAHVIATDKVVRIGAGKVPETEDPGPPNAVYAKDEWTYGQMLAFVAHQRKGSPVLVEMESYGIATIAKALGLLNRVVVIRIVTDCLTDHAESDVPQAELLLEGRKALAVAIDAIALPHGGD